MGLFFLTWGWGVERQPQAPNECRCLCNLHLRLKIRFSERWYGLPWKQVSTSDRQRAAEGKERDCSAQGGPSKISELEMEIIGHAFLFQGHFPAGSLPTISLPFFSSGISSRAHTGVAFHGVPLPENKATSGIKYSTHIPWGNSLTCGSSSDVEPPGRQMCGESHTLQHPAPRPEIAFVRV